MTSKYRIDKDGRECTKCDDYKLWEFFHKNRASENGHATACKECWKGKRYDNNKGINQVTDTKALDSAMADAFLRAKR